jgi:hypothetical protein
MKHLLVNPNAKSGLNNFDASEKKITLQNRHGMTILQGNGI